MDFKQYLANAEKTFKFQIKTLFPLDNAVMDLLEKALQKYRPVSVSKPKKTMFHSNPLGFTGVKCAEVFIFDVELSVPVTATILEFDLHEILHLGKDSELLKVFGEHSSDLGASMEPLGSEDEKHAALLTNENYEEVEEAKFEDHFGDAYNARFKAYLKKVEGERAKEKGRGAKIDAKHPLTTWANQPDATPKDSDTEQKK